MIRLSDFRPRARPSLLPPAAAGEPWLMTVIAVLCFLACLTAVAASAAYGRDLDEPGLSRLARRGSGSASRSIMTLPSP